MSRRSLMPLAILVLTTACAGALDCFVLLDNIPGESTHPWHTNWIDAQLVGSQISRPAFGAAVFELSFTKTLDQSSPLLALRAADHRPINGGQIDFVTDVGRRLRFYRITLTNAYVTSFSQAADSTSVNRADESLGLAFESISWTYTQIDAAGMPRQNVGASWDLLSNRGSGSAEPLVRLTGSKEGQDMVLTWTGRAVTTYNVLGSAQVSGPYGFLQSVTASSNGTMRVTFPFNAANLFFQVETVSPSP